MNKRNINLNFIARRRDDTWLGFAHTVAYGEPFAENMLFKDVILSYPCVNEKTHIQQDLPGDLSISECPMQDGSIVRFLQVIPIYKTETDYKISSNAGNLWRKFADETYKGYTTVGNSGGVYLRVNLPTGRESEEDLQKILPLIKEQLKWVEENKNEVEKAVVDGGGVKLANEWARKGKKLATDEGECYMLDNGEEVFLPITEKTFCDSLYCDGVDMDFDSEKPQIYLYVRFSPDYFEGRYMQVFVDGEKFAKFEELSDE